MKPQLLLLLTLLPFLSFAQAPIDTVDIPDGHFKWALLNPGFMGMDIIDTNGDGEIQYSEAEAVTFLQLDPSVMGGYSIENNIYNTQNDDSFDVGPIGDLTGIEAFTNLRRLIISSNNLTIIDLSQNTELDTLIASGNHLSSIELNDNNSLKVLDCDNNNIQSLDVSQQSELIKLSCDNNQIDSLDLSSATNLQKIRCLNNQLTYLDLRNKNGDLTFCQASMNPDLTCIYVDDKEYAENAPYWSKDSTAHYVETEEECEALGVEDYVFQKIDIYPNPVRNTLHFSNAENLSEIAVFNMQGKKLQTLKGSRKGTIDFSSYAPGIYFLKMTANHQSQIQKIIKL